MDDDGTWDCSVCTYKNRSEAFKCEICDTRKGTSTRKPRVTPTIVAQQIASSFPPIPPLPPASKYQKTVSGRRSITRRSSSSQPKLKNVDRNSGRDIEVTVDGVTVVITDYKLLPKKDELNTRQTSEEETSSEKTSEEESSCVQAAATDT